MNDLSLRLEATAIFEQTGVKALRRMIDAMPLEQQNGKYAIPGLGSVGSRVHTCDAQAWLRLKEEPGESSTSS